jgi:Flp pilus assembly protein TadD
LLEKQAKLHPEDPFVLYNLGATYKAVGNLDAARRTLEAAAKFDRGALSSTVREGLSMRLAQLALAAKQDAVAVEHARKALAISPANPVALQVLALGLLAANDLAGAVDAFTKLRASPSLDPALASDVDRVLAQLAPNVKNRATKR